MKVADLFAMVVMLSFAAVALALPLYVIIRSVINFAHAVDGRGAIVVKAVVSLGVWLIISMSFVFIPFMLVFEPGTKDMAAADRKITIVTVVLTILYIVIGLALAYWVRLQPGWKTQVNARYEA
jgi:hypothetical protein